MVGHQTLCEDGWWEIGCTRGPSQIKTEDEVHHVKGKKQDSAENELMNRMTRRERTGDPGRNGSITDQKKARAWRSELFRTLYSCTLIVVYDKQEMMKNEMMNLMMKRGGQNTQEGTSENQQKVKRNSDKLKDATQYTTTRCETSPLLKLAGQLEMCLCVVWCSYSQSFLCARTAAKELREKLGDENGETDLQQVSLSLNEEEAVHGDGKWHTTCGVDGWKCIPQRHAIGCCCRSGDSLCSEIKSERELRLERTGRDDEP